MPQMLYLYVVLPIYGLSTDKFEFLSRAGYWDELANFQFVADLMCISMIFGIWWASRNVRKFVAPIPKKNPKAIFAVGMVFGILGSAAWLIGIINVGGFDAAYGHAYGGGWDDSGYVREAAQFGFVATPLIILSRRTGGMKPQHWLLVLLFLFPLLVQGLLGARRGPTFLALAAVAGSYILVFRPRVPFAFAAVGGFTVGTLLLWLVANRGAIYLGSDRELNGSVSMMLQNWAGNEYLFSSAIVRYVNETGDTFSGLRIFAHMSARIVPHSLWPTKYADVVSALGLNIDLTQGAGIPVDRIATISGWDIAVGAAPSFVGDFWLEFGWMAPLAIFSVGWLYGKLWSVSRSDPRVQPAYVMLAALSIYLLTQTIEAWLFRSLLFGLPALLILRGLGQRAPSQAMLSKQPL
ncbi:MAG TPA: oligosaccharide repeat unit polymerase [Hyphomicrobium sp.]|nr:oligosaccharide repeat unit polymerase [Hyphomicrobium sp.]